MELESQRINTSFEQPSVISIKNLNKNFGQKQVLININLEIKRGEIIGYIGPNGAGKSTTVKVLTGLIGDFEGEVKVLGFDLKTDAIEVKKRSGYIPELNEIYDLLTPKEYLHFVGQLYQLTSEEIEKRTESWLKAFGLLENKNQRMDSFSKGMRQKILLASGLIHNPEIVIMDEPLSGLDANAVIMVKELLQVLKKQGKTIFYCSHMMDVVEKVSDRIVLIDKGEIIADGTIDELRSGGNDSLEMLFAKLTNSTQTNESKFNELLGDLPSTSNVETNE